MPSAKTETVARAPVQPRLGHRSLRFRLTAILVGILAIALLSFAALLYSAFVRDSRREFDAALYNHAVDVARGIRVDFFGDLHIDNEALSSGGKIFPFSVGMSLVQVLSGDGKIVARSRALGDIKLPLARTQWQTLNKLGVVFQDIPATKIPTDQSFTQSSYRLLTYLVRDGSKPNFILQIAAPTTLLDLESRGLFTFFMLSIPLMLVFAMVGGYFVAARALAPVSAIIGKARELSATRLSERIPVPPAKDELRQLTLSINDLLDRLQGAFESQERFVSDASHQLKTPLAIVRGELEVLRSRERKPEEIHETIDSALQELDHLSRMVEDLLLLARMDAGREPIERTSLRLDEVVLEAVSRLDPLARSRDSRLKIDLDESADPRFYEVKGDPDLLRSLLQSLIENAIKYSPAGSAVEVSLKRDGSAAVVLVTDQGPGIPEELLPRVFERFNRGAADTRSVQGTGLGLAIARRIAEAHGGKLEASNVPAGGARFEFRLDTARGH